MKILISPAKTLDFESASPFSTFTMPQFLGDSCELMDQLKTHTPEDLSTLMKISAKLGDLNYARNQDWQIPFTQENAKACIFAFKGDVYTGLEAETLTKKEITFAQDHLRILSGLYGLLKPLDLIQPYRLEMGTKLSNTRGDNLYQFWADTLTKTLREEENKVVINLASNEYSKAVDLKHFDLPVITPVFKDMKNGQYKIISFFAKKARGLMSRYIIQERIKKAEDIKYFDIAGYSFNSKLTRGNEWVFTRSEAS